MKKLLLLTLALPTLLSCASLPSGGPPVRVAVFSKKPHVETLGLEKYLVGVLNKEVPSNWPPEALKAQAVAARTYALYRVKHPRNSHFDMASDVSDQAFERNGHYPDTIIQAVRETKGQTLEYKGQIFEAFFHSCCGGVNESFRHVWPGLNDPPPDLPHQDPYCSASPRSQWQYQIARKDFRERLISKGYPMEDKWDEDGEIEVSHRNEFGRVEEVLVGDRIISGTDFRDALGPQNLPSTLFEITDDNDPLIFSGRGSGHGVGLCQWGAKGMADQGKTYLQILGFYYPDAEMVGPKGKPIKLPSLKDSPQILPETRSETLPLTSPSHPVDTE